MPGVRVDSPQIDVAEALRAAGLRVTAARLGVIQALAARPHSDTDTVIGIVRQDLGAVSTQAVYNVLAALVAVGLVRRIEPAGSPALYEVRVGDNHHHIVCRACGSTTDVDCAVGRRPCLTPSESRGYVLDEAEVTFWGLCPECQPSTTDQVGTTSVKEKEAGQ
ncbi:MAG TPA: Fur family transcriptional regulator [Acidimicrobiales bacterium]|nr:Fur family transcriptional regulator [Acidimicrobiales bacterium]